ncbi:MAG: hypothetical protein H6974_06140 [Gammaproteobacteria bacterium]|nr:hypothetical protein [Gammaproteobacteria bacterium]MCP5196348.1 hypothetical protein [Gammaproteobacteria bacterium]
MTERDDKQVTRVEAVADAAPVQGRRRFVKGAAIAMPAVMTLLNGRLAAASSTTCLVNRDTITPPVAVNFNSDDEWVREAKTFRRYRYQGTNIWSADGGNTFYDSTGNPVIISPGPSPSLRPQTQGGYQLVYIDNDGNPVSAGSGLGAPATDSCYSSFII